MFLKNILCPFLSIVHEPITLCHFTSRLASKRKNVHSFKKLFFFLFDKSIKTYSTLISHEASMFLIDLFHKTTLIPNKYKA